MKNKKIHRILLLFHFLSRVKQIVMLLLLWRNLPCLLLLLASLSLYAQQRAQVLDAHSREPLPFVNVLIGKNQLVLTTDIEGRFELPDSLQQGVLTLSYVGYEEVRLELPLNRPLILLRPQIYALQEVVVTAKSDPAWQIMQKVIENRRQHDPNRYAQYRYKSYNQQLATLDIPAAPLQSAQDSTTRRIAQFLEKRYLFFAENITLSSFVRPSYRHEEVIANKMSGFREPIFAILGSSIIPFSFYDPSLSILGEYYLNPVSMAHWRQYDFYLQDTLYSTADTLYIISFEPARRSQGNLMEGVLYINGSDYAIRDVIARNANKNVDIGFRFHQSYQLVSGRWFPAELSVDFVLNNLKVDINEQSYPLRFVNRTRIEEVSFTDVQKQKGSISFEIAPRAHLYDGWQAVRPDSLSIKAIATYDYLDSLSQVTKLEQRLNWAVDAAWSNSLPLLRYFELPFERLFGFDQFQGLRLGLGLYTSPRLWQPLRLGGYVAYGFRDQRWKYGADMELFLHRRSHARLLLAYWNDLEEPGQLQFAHDLHRQRLQTDIRRLFAHHMSAIEAWKVGLALQPLRFVHLQAYWQQSRFEPLFGYSMLQGNESINRFAIPELHLHMAYTFGERYAWAGGRLRLLESSFPQLLLHYTRGWQANTAELGYHSLQMRLRWLFGLPSGFELHCQVSGAKAWGSAPAFRLFHGEAAYDDGFWLYAPLHFQTMGLYEFLTDAYMATALEWWSPTLRIIPLLQPRLVLQQKMAWGWLSKPQLHQGISTNTFEKGFYESGLLVDGLIRMRGLFSKTYIGGGVFLRYGPYAWSGTAANTVFRLSLRLGR